MLFRRTLPIFAFLLLFVSSAAAQTAVYRDWTAVDAKKKNARFVRLDHGVVILETRNREDVRLPLEKLSPPDMDFIQKNYVNNRQQMLTNLPSADQFLEMAMEHAQRIPAKREQFRIYLKIMNYQQQVGLDYRRNLVALRQLYNKLDGSAEKLEVTRDFIAFLVRGSHFQEAEKYIFADDEDLFRDTGAATTTSGKWTLRGFGADPLFSPLARLQLYQHLAECMIEKGEYQRVMRIMDILEANMDKTSWQLQDRNYADIAVLEAKMGLISEAYQTVAIIRTANIKMHVYCRIIPMLYGTSREKDIPALLDHVYRFAVQRDEKATVVLEQVEAAELMNAFLSAYLAVRRKGYTDGDERAKSPAGSRAEEYLKAAQKFLARLPEGNRHTLMRSMLELCVLLDKDQPARDSVQQYAKSKIPFLMYLADVEMREKKTAEAEKTLDAAKKNILLISKIEDRLPDLFWWAEKMQALGKTKDVNTVLVHTKAAIPTIKNVNARAAAYGRFAHAMIALNDLENAKKLTQTEEDWGKKCRFCYAILRKHLENGELISAYGLLNFLADNHSLAAEALLDFARAVE